MDAKKMTKQTMMIINILTQQLLPNKGGLHHQRQTEAMNPDWEKEDSGEVSSSGAGIEPATGSAGGSPAHRHDSEASSLGNSIFYDDPDIDDGFEAPDPVLTAKAIARTKQKIEDVKDQIRKEQVRLRYPLWVLLGT